MSKNKLFLFIVALPVALYASLPTTVNDFNLDQNNRALWDTIMIFQGSTTLRRVAIGNHIKSSTDDTIRIFTVQSVGTRMVLLFTDTSSALPMKWRSDILETSGAGFMQVGIGDVDRNGVNDLVYARSSTPYRLKRAYWDNNNWAYDSITTMTGSSWAMTVGDADNDGYNDDIIYAQGVTANCHLMHAHYNGTTWDISQIWAGDGSTMQGVAIADFDAGYPGNEIVTAGGGRVMRIRWTGSAWDTLTLWQVPANGSFCAVAIGNFDSQNVGNEIAVGNGLGPGSMAIGAVIEIYGSGDNWQARPIFTPDTNENCWGLASGDFLSTNPGEELVKSGSFSYYVRAIWGAGDTWHNEIMFEIPGSSYGAAVGNINKHRPYNDEIVLTGNYQVIETEERITLVPFISNISHHPLVPCADNYVMVSAKIYDQSYPLPLNDTLFYQVEDTLGAWQYALKDSFRLSDSMHFYTIPPQDTGSTVYFKIAATNGGGGRNVSSIDSYPIALEHTIYQIQHTTTANDTSPDYNRWVVTTGTVTGVFGRFFYVEEQPGGAWHGLYIRRPNASDSLPTLVIGDSGFGLVRVTEYQKTTVGEIVYADGAWIESVAQNCRLPCTTVTTFVQAVESLEGCLVRFDNVHFNATGNFLASTYWIYNQVGESLAVYIWPYTDIVGNPIPTGQISAIGCLYHHLTPYNYELIPRATSDFISLPGIENPSITNPINLSFRITPNPAKTQTFIYYTLPIQSTVELKLYNVVGKLVYSAQIPKAAIQLPENSFTLDTKPLVDGVYLLLFKTNGFETTKKILITH
jgi:hypothetical protein